MSTVGQITTRNICSIPHNNTVQQAVKQMRDRKIGSLMVEKDRELVGIVTETDVVRKAAAEGLDLKNTQVHQIMSSPIISLNVNSPVSDAHGLMAENAIRHLAVTDAGGIIGIVSVRDIMNHMREDRGWVDRFLSSMD